MLKQRVITGLLMFALCLTVLLWFNLIAFALAIAALVLLLAWEWSALIGLKKKTHRFAYLLLTCLSLALVAWLPSLPVLVVAVLLWCLLVYVVLCYEREHVSVWVTSPWLSGLIGLLVCSALWVSMNRLFVLPQGRSWLLYSLAVVWVMDIGGYFVGRRWGRRSLSPRVSPKKTWEGMAGGLMCLLPVVLFALWHFHLFTRDGLLVFVASYLAAIFAVFGDLYESVLKRFSGVKDSGSILPGHGGVLDRMDGVLAALPLLALASFALV